MDFAVAFNKYVEGKPIMRFRLRGTMVLTKGIKLFLLAFLAGTLSDTGAQAQTINAASCSSTDVQAAFNAVTSSITTVNIPAGTCHWTSEVVLAVPTGSTTLSILGAGNLSTLGGGDATVIVDDYVSSSPDLAITTGNASSKFRLAGITFKGGTGSVKFNGMVGFVGFTQNLRIDHDHFLNPVSTGAGLRMTGWMYGVIDHNLCDLNGTGSVNNCFRVSTGANWNGDTAGQGDKAWADSPYFGTSQALFIEDNTINNGYVNDCDSGSHQVIRHNTINGGNIQAHEMANDMRGCRVTEVYQNTFSSISVPITIRAGTGMFWGNSGAFNIGTGFLELDLDRSNTQHGFAAPPANWGFCGTQATGAVDSSWDQADSTLTGYACLDQPGRGKGDLLTGFFPNKINSVSGVISWPRQAVEPIYEFDNGGMNAASVFAFSTSVGCSISVCTTPTNADRDYYQHSTNFNGTSGTGTGLLSARPATCTAGLGGNTPGVGYFATDTSTLYVCNPANTWSAYYTPYTYPHPLTLNSGSGNSPAPPTGLSVTVH